MSVAKALCSASAGAALVGTLTVAAAVVLAGAGFVSRLSRVDPVDVDVDVDVESSLLSSPPSRSEFAGSFGGGGAGFTVCAACVAPANSAANDVAGLSS
jgi:hypothetical protein